MCSGSIAWAQDCNSVFENIADLLEFGLNRNKALEGIDMLNIGNNEAVAKYIERYGREDGVKGADMLLADRRNAAIAFHKLAVEKLGEFDSTTIRLKLISLWLESLFEKDEQKILEYTNYIKQHLSEIKGVEANKVLVSLDCMALEKKMSCKYGYSPEEYIAYLAQERNVMEAFPVPEDEKSWWRMRAYRSMGNSRTMITRPNNLYVCSIGTEYDVYKNSELKTVNGEVYSELNNSPSWYYGRVNEIANHLYKQDLAKKDTDYGTWLSVGEPGIEVWGTPESMDYIKKIYGSNNPNIFKYTYLGMLKTFLASGCDKYIIDSYAKDIENCEGLTDAQKLIWQFELYKKVFNFFPDTSKYKFTEINGKICDNENTTYEWDELAHRLFDVDVHIFDNYNDSFWKSLSRNRILKQLGGYYSPLTSMHNIEYLDFMLDLNENRFKESLKTYKELAEFIEEPLRSYVLDEYKLIEIHYHLYITKDLSKVKKLAREILSKNDVNPDIRNEVLVDAVIAESVLTGKSDNTENMISESLTYYQKQPASMRNMSSLIGIALYYNNVKDGEKAREVIDFAIETQIELCGKEINNTYIQLRENLSSISNLQGHSNEKRRIISEDTERIVSDPFLIPTCSMLNYLWTAYDIAKNDNVNDVSYIGYFVNAISAVTIKLMQTTSNVNKFNRTYLVPLMAEMLWINTKFEIEQNNINFDNLTDEMRKTNEDQKKALAAVMSQMDPVMAMCEELLTGETLTLREASCALRYYSNKSAYINFVLKDKNKAKKALEQVKKLKFPESMKIQIDMSLSNFYVDLNDFIESEKYFKRYLNEVGDENLNTFYDRRWLHFFYYNYYKQLGDNAKALEEARKYYNVMKEELNTHFQLMTSADQENFMNMYGDPAQLICRELEKNPESLAKEVYDGVVYRTGMQLRSQQATQRAIETTSDPKLKEMRDTLHQMRLQYSKFEASFDDQERQKEANNLMRKIRLQEQKIFDMTADARKDVNRTVTWEMVRDKLTPESAAIEFVFSENHIMALVLKPRSQSPEVVKLSRLKDLEDYLKGVGAKNTSVLAKKLYGIGKAELYTMLWQPMEKLLDGVKNVYFTAPGILNSICFNAMSDEKGEYVFDKYSLHQLTTTAELVNSQDKELPCTAAIAGDVLFSPSQQTLIGNNDLNASREVDAEYALDDFSERGVARQYFRYLPFTAMEIDAISKNLGALKVKTTRQLEATEGNLRNLCASKPDILHLATHGFFLSTEAEARNVPYMRKFQKSIGNSMQRAGVALYGAEETWRGEDKPEEDDGILTAVEVSGLNLKGTKLVVLSACETALGNYSYEGVYGLPRGFKQAGVQSLLVSLWSVNDHSTSQFMTEFYKNWMNGMTKHQAYHQAIKQVRISYPEPYNWAPFILLD